MRIFVDNGRKKEKLGEVFNRKGDNMRHGEQLGRLASMIDGGGVMRGRRDSYTPLKTGCKRYKRNKRL
jgi:hypothetical protein